MKINKIVELTQEEKEIFGKASDLLNEILGEYDTEYDINKVYEGKVYSVYEGKVYSSLSIKEILNAITVLETLR